MQMNLKHIREYIGVYQYRILSKHEPLGDFVEEGPGVYAAQISINGTIHWRGGFATAEDAAKAYDEMLRPAERSVQKFYNFPGEGELGKQNRKPKGSLTWLDKEWWDQVVA